MIVLLTTILAVWQMSAPPSQPSHDRQEDRLACENGYIQRCVEAGRAEAYHGHDLVLATSLFERGCEQNDAASCAELGLSLVAGRGIEADWERAGELLNGSCQAGYPLGCTYMALLLHEAHENAGLQVNWESAVYFYRRACNLGEDNACYNLSGIYSGWFESPIRTDIDAAIQSLEASCSRDFEPNCVLLADLLRQTGSPADLDRHLAILERQCERDYGDACHGLGYAYVHSVGVSRNDAEAITLFERACALGSAIGCTNLGWMHEESRVPFPSLEEAASLYAAGCQGGYQPACDMATSLRESGEHQ